MSAVLKAQEPSARYLAAEAPPLVQQFDLLATASGGLTRLRELILTLAVRGKLVEQGAEDEPASRLLARIRSKREELIAAGQISRDRPFAAIDEAKMPFDLPLGWKWSRFGDYVDALCTGPFGSLIHKQDYVAGGVPLINPSHMVGGRILHDPEVAVSKEMASRLSAYRLSRGDVLLARRGEVGRYALVTEREDGWLCGTGSFFVKLNADCNRNYFGLMLDDPALRRHLQGESVGSTMTNLNQRILLDSPLAVPPLAEQARIAARVDELMHLCDALEAKGRLEAEHHQQLLTTLLGTLTDSRTPEELADNWQRVADHFDLLLDRPEAVDVLEQTIMQLAVRGLLVRQSSSDEPASHILRRISSEKDELFADGKLKRETPTSDVSEREHRFAPPEGWVWARLEQLATVIVDCPHSTPRFSDSGVLCIDTNSFKNGQLLPAKLRFVDQATFEERTQRIEPKPGDLVFAREGSVGESIIIPRGTTACLGQRVMLFRFSDQVSNEFVRLSITTQEFLGSLLSLHKGIGAKHVNVGDMRKAVVPVPPLAEQKRIFERVGELRLLCAILRDRLSSGRSVQSKLADALVANAATARTL